MDIPSWIWPIAVSPIIGSFLGAVIKRVEEPHSIVLGRSSCESCHATVRTSKFATDVNVPGVAQCQTCHRPAQVKATCATCHVYHPTSAASLAVATR